ncbi:MAG: CBS domain-containing protein [Desulfobulbaceae bacterium]|nr:CBS domain-containing protein [Desulfobulbaceae bacterium]
MKAKDIMSPIGDFLSPDMTLHEAVIAIRKCKRSHGLSVKGMLVLDNNKNVVGILSIKDIMGAVIPPYLSPDLSLFSWDNMLEQMTDKCRNKKISDIMAREVFTVGQETPLMVCVDFMIKKKLQRIPVMDDNKNILGMVYIRDLYEIIANILIKEENK